MTDNRLDRRRFVALGAAAFAATAMPAVRPAFAKSEVTLGDITITSVSDGHLTLPTNMLAANASDAERAGALQAAGQDGDAYRSPLNVTVIKTPNDLIMVDVGAGPNFMSSAGGLIDALDEAGIDRAAVTKVVYTHAHPDHMWGTFDDFDELVFPDATYHIAEAERAFWMADDILTRLPEDRHAFAAGAQRNIKGVDDKLEMLKPGQDVVTGVRVIDTGGHTPGHISLEVGSGNDTLVVLGDALTHPVISFEYPAWTPAMDQEKDRAVATRQALLKRLAANRSRIIGYHLPQPGIGRVEAAGTGFKFVAG